MGPGAPPLLLLLPTGLFGEASHCESQFAPKPVGRGLERDPFLRDRRPVPGKLETSKKVGPSGSSPAPGRTQPISSAREVAQPSNTTTTVTLASSSAFKREGEGRVFGQKPRGPHTPKTATAPAATPRALGLPARTG